jgi:hypothetical protein
MNLHIDHTLISSKLKGAYRHRALLLLCTLIGLAVYFAASAYFSSRTDQYLIALAKKSLVNYETYGQELGMSMGIGDDKIQPYVAQRTENQATVIVPYEVRLGRTTPAMVTLIRENGKWKAFSFVSKLGDRTF